MARHPHSIAGATNYLHERGRERDKRDIRKTNDVSFSVVKSGAKQADTHRAAKSGKVNSQARRSLSLCHIIITNYNYILVVMTHTAYYYCCARTTNYASEYNQDESLFYMLNAD